MDEERLDVVWGQLSFLPLDDDDFRIVTDGEPPAPIRVMWFGTIMTWPCPFHGAHHHPVRAVVMFCLN